MALAKDAHLQKTSRMRVLQIIFGLDIESKGGGIERFGVDLTRSLDSELFEVILCGLARYETAFESRRLQELASQGVQTYLATTWEENRPYQSFWRAFTAIRSYIRRTPVDIVHSHNEFADILALLLKISNPGLKILRTVHYGYHFEWRKRPIRRLLLTNFLYPVLFDAETGVSQTIADRLNHRRLAALLNRKAICIHNAIDLRRFDHVRVDWVEKKKSLGLPPNAALIGSIGRLTEQKGYPILVDAAAQVLQKLPQSYFLIIGDGEMRAELKQRARSLGVEERVNFCGPRSDVEELLGCMDLFASSSLWEGLPTVIMEAMASGVPVVATDIPGTRDLIQDGDNGWLAPTGDPGALADAILTAMGTPELRASMSERGLQVVRAYSIESVAAQYAALYQELGKPANPKN
jgi:glycosyltransferase involved in cell wall biosynthesis